ncbi:amidase family protein [Corynebacterium appendicis]|uniref:amidase family protein n=1 Tax=Corynebacterium appendicis TaxID=163202 RepID=UPI000970C4B1|nr:amidase family protein [Corynebacterium appendicis]
MHPAFSFLPTEPLPRNRGGRLGGWVIPAKDTADVAGWPTSWGNPSRRTIAAETSPFVEWMLREGVQINGKTVTSELGATIYAERPGVPVLSSPAYPGCTPGGSSTGAAVVVAEGLHRAAHGSDAGGSLRVPAAACEVVGFKPAGRPVSGSVDGFITASVADQIELWGTRPRGLEGLTVGVLTQPLFTPNARVAADRAAVVEQAAAAVSDVCEVLEIAPYPAATETYRHFSARIKQAFAKADPKDSAYIAWLRDEGRSVTPSQLSTARHHIDALPEVLRAEWGVDAVITPMIATDPPPLGFFPSLPPADSFEAQTEWSPWGSLFNLTGAPAIAVGPVQIGGVSAAADDAAVLELARLVEPVVAGWRETRAPGR